MDSKGVIYDKTKGNLHGEKVITMDRMTLVKYKTLRTLGATLASFSMAAVIYSYTPLLASDQSVTSDIVRTESQMKNDVPKPKYIEQYSISIPKIGAYSDVILNVDTSNEEEYMEALRQGVAHAKGSSLPGAGGRTFLFAHSTDSPLNIVRYNAVFYQLRNLEIGDEIFISDGYKNFVYEVSDKKIVDASDTSWLNKGEEEELILQTCDPPGTIYKRLLVIAKPTF